MGSQGRRAPTGHGLAEAAACRGNQETWGPASAGAGAGAGELPVTHQWPVLHFRSMGGPGPNKGDDSRLLGLSGATVHPPPRSAISGDFQPPSSPPDPRAPLLRAAGAFLTEHLAPSSMGGGTQAPAELIPPEVPQLVQACESCAPHGSENTQEAKATLEAAQRAPLEPPLPSTSPLALSPSCRRDTEGTAGCPAPSPSPAHPGQGQVPPHRPCSCTHHPILQPQQLNTEGFLFTPFFKNVF